MYNQDNSGSSFTLGLLAGAALGAGLAILYAPKAGSEVRGHLRRMGEDAMSSLGEVGRSIRHSTEKIVDRGREAVSEVAREGERAFDRATSEVARATNDITSRRTGSML
jgi:gas vesicle protein